MIRVRTRVKICCIGSPEEAAVAVAAGADAVGLVTAMPSGPGVIDEETLRRIAATVPPGVTTFMLTSERETGSLVEQQFRCRCNVLQLCDVPQPGAYAKLRDAFPELKLVQVIHVRGPDAVQQALEAAPSVDALLLDSGDPTRVVKELGGTGRGHDWTLSRRIVESVTKPVFLAGGLNQENVGQAIRTVQPFAVDLCSGVRTHGHLDAEKLRGFFQAVKRADAALAEAEAAVA